MKRLKRFAAVFLAAAMIVTSIQMPVYAAQDETVSIEQENLQSTEDSAPGQPEKEQPAQEGSTEQLAADTGKEEVAEDVATEEPKAGDTAAEQPEDTASGMPETTELEAAEESVAGQSEEEIIVEQPENALDETVTGADSTRYVYSAKDLLDALNASSEGSSKKGSKTETVKIALKGDNADYEITAELLKEKKLTVQAGQEVVIEDQTEDGIIVRFAADVAAADAVLTVPGTSALTLVAGAYNLKVVNEGIFKTKENLDGTGVSIESALGNSFENKAKATADFDGGSISSIAEGSIAVVNEADGIMSIGGETEITAAKDNATAKSLTAIQNAGTLTVNEASIEATGDEAASCAIENTGTLSVRGGNIDSSAVAIYNTGTAELGSPLARDVALNISNGINAALPTVLTLSGGKVIVYGDSDSDYYANGVSISTGSGAAVSTTPFVGGNNTFKATGTGTFVMFGGYVEGIAYEGTNYPTLLGGTIENDNGACVLYTAKDTKEPDAKKSFYYYYNTAEESPEKQQISAAEDDGTYKTEITPMKGGSGVPSGSSNTYVYDEEGLRKALSEGKKNIYAQSITLNDNLAIDKDVVIRGVITTSANTITIAKDKNVEFSGLDIMFRGLADGATAITNEGNLTLNNSDITCTGAEGLKVLANAGALSICSMSDIKIDDMTAGIAVYNTGKFVMNDGSITAGKGNKDSYAIVYTGDNLPVLIMGDVCGSLYNVSVPQDYTKLTEGAAVVKDNNGTYEKGAFLNTEAEGAAAQDTKNSVWILDGVAQERREMNSIVEQEYLLMEVGEKLDAEDIAKLFNRSAGYLTAGYWSMTSSDACVKATLDGQNSSIEAVSKGYATVTIGVSNHVDAEGKVSDTEMSSKNYIRIEVVGAGERAKLIADNYAGNILNQNVLVNGYKYSPVDVGFEFHIKGSYGEENTGGDLHKVMQETYKVSDIRIDDEEFNRYFAAELVNTPVQNFVTPTDGVEHTGYDPDKKYYSIKITPKYDDGEADSDSDSTNLIIDDIKGIKDVEATVILKADKEGFHEIPVKLGKFNITVKSSAPKFKTAPIEINRFYNYGSAHIKEHIVVSNDIEEVSSVKAVTCTAGIHVDNSGDVSVTGKKGGKISADVEVDNYVGKYPATLTVKVTNKAPKVSLKEKKISVYGKTSAETDIVTSLLSKDNYSGDNDSDVSRILNVEVAGKSADFYKAILTDTYRNEAKGKSYIHYRDIILQPKQSITKATTVELKVTFYNTRRVKGKEYAVNLKLKVSPVKNLTVKQSVKPRINKETVSGNTNDSGIVKFTLNPKTYRGGKIIVTGLNGKGSTAQPLPEELTFGSVIDYKDGTYGVRVTANEKTKNAKKDVKFAVQIIAQEGESGVFKSMLKKPAVMTVSLYDEKAPEIKKKEAVIDMGKVKAAEGINAYIAMEELSSTKEWNTLRTKLKASYKVSSVGKWDVSTDSALFTASKTTNTKTGDLTSVVLYPEYDAYYAGKIQVGNKYIVNVTLKNNRGTVKTETLVVTVKDVKKADVTLEDAGSGEKKDAFTLYWNSPYTLDSFEMGYDSDVFGSGSGWHKDCSSTPYMGLTVRNVEIADANSPYEVIRYKNTNADHYTYALTFKDKKKPTGVTKKQLQTVTLKITYSNGVNNDYFSAKPCLKKMKVNIPDLPKIK
ncbi:hypothetical protein D7X88_02515 [bacterium C-53]|nr:hypothetical protein [Lachnospiraceae bacterium]NBI01892.1 hypothetical protein [Lachnospiraceae bacterium]RKJ12298.1 hypothetical protein D7X88_02515 [bacterium C-53]